MQLFEPWTTANLYANELEHELKTELSNGHVLESKPVTIIARRKDNDDVLVKVMDEPVIYAVVHLTWSKSKERVPTCPRTTIYGSWDKWVNECMLPAHRRAVQSIEILGEDNEEPQADDDR
jgi:hypothetical protein